jgi:hypothetical protein
MAGSTQVPTVDAVGDGDDLGTALNVRPHIVRGVAVELGDGVGHPREAERADGHVERVPAEGDELLVG